MCITALDTVIIMAITYSIIEVHAKGFLGALRTYVFGVDTQLPHSYRGQEINPVMIGNQDLGVTASVANLATPRERVGEHTLTHVHTHTPMCTQMCAHTHVHMHTHTHM